MSAHHCPTSPCPLCHPVYGSGLMGHDIGDAMDRLVDRASRPEPKQLNKGRGAGQQSSEQQ